MFIFGCSFWTGHFSPEIKEKRNKTGEKRGFLFNLSLGKERSPERERYVSTSCSNRAMIHNVYTYIYTKEGERRGIILKKYALHSNAAKCN